MIKHVLYTHAQHANSSCTAALQEITGDLLDTCESLVKKKKKIQTSHAY